MMDQFDTLLQTFVSQLFGPLGLAEEAGKQLRPYTKLRSLTRKEDLLRHGDRWDKFFYIQSGILRMFYIDLEGKESNKAFFGEGQCIWPVAPMDRNTSILFNIAAIPQTELLTCQFEPVYQLLHQAGCWERFALPFAERLLESKFHREHDFLQLSASERYQKMLATYPSLIDRIPDYHLASYLGITNVSLSRLKKNSNF